MHPSVIIEVVERLQKLNPSGQIWIATHCVPLLAALPPESFWYVNGGTVSWAGRCPEVVLEGLLGGPNGRERMEEFLRLPAQYANNKFAAECLVPPNAVDTPSTDPQARQLRKFCQDKINDQSKLLRVLDFGAGVGRLLAAMSELWDAKRLFTNAVDYRAYERETKPAAQLKQTILSVYGEDPTSRYFANEDDLSKMNPRSVDVVVMCNVLHEVPPLEWAKLFGAKGMITKLLAQDGVLLLLEDMEIPHGENAHRYGFLLLEPAHLRTLLCCKEADGEIPNSLARDGRLSMQIVPSKLLGRTTRESSRAAIEALKKTSISKIPELRKAKADSRSGQLHALWTQLLANAVLALDEL